MKLFYTIFYFIAIFFSTLGISQSFGSNTCNTIYNINKTLYNENFKHFNYANPNAKFGGILKLASKGNFNTLLPYEPTKQLPSYYLTLSYDTLFVSPLDDVNGFYPLIASDYCIKQNSIIININPHAIWSNGEPITAHDLQFTLSLINKKSHPLYINLTNHILNINIVSKKKIEIRMDKIDNTILSLLFSLPIVNENNQITSGAYVVELFEENKEIILKYNTNYWAKNLPSRKYHFNFEKIIIKNFIINKDNMNQIINDKINFYKPNNESMEKFNNSQLLNLHNLKIIQIPIHSTPPFVGLFFNLNKPPFHDKNIRKAISLAFDFELIKRNFFSHELKRFNSLFINSVFYGNNTINQSSKLIEAANYLDKTPYIYENNKRVHKKTGEPLSLLIVFNNYNTAIQLQSFISNIEQLGINVKWKVINKTQQLQLLQNKNFHLMQADYIFSNQPITQINEYFNKPNGPYNYTNINDIKLQNLIAKARGSNLIKAIRNIDSYLFGLDIFIPLYYNPFEFYIIKKNFVPTITNYGIDLWSSYFEK